MSDSHLFSVHRVRFPAENGELLYASVLDATLGYFLLSVQLVPRLDLTDLEGLMAEMLQRQHTSRQRPGCEGHDGSENGIWGRLARDWVGGGITVVTKRIQPVSCSWT